MSGDGGRAAGSAGLCEGGPAPPPVSCRPQDAAAEERGGRRRAARLWAEVEQERRLDEAVRRVRPRGRGGRRLRWLWQRAPGGGRSPSAARPRGASPSRGEV